MFLDRKAPLLMLLLIFCRKVVLSNPVKCEVEQKRDSSIKAYVIRGCDAVNFKTTLAKWKTQLVKQELFDFKIAGNNIQTIEEGSLSGEKIHYLEILNNTGLTNVHFNFIGAKNVLVGITIIQPDLNLQTIHFGKSLKYVILRVKEISEEQMNVLPDTVRSINITKTRIGSSNKVVISKKYNNLQNITLAECNLTGLIIKKLLFNVRYLDLSGNKLDCWGNVTFGMMPSLLYINLADNQFLYLDNSTLSILIRLEELNVSGNSIKNITTDIFQKIRSLKYIRNSYRAEKDSAEVFMKPNFGGPIEHILVGNSNMKLYLYIASYALFEFFLSAFASAIYFCKFKTRIPTRCDPNTAVVPHCERSCDGNSDSDPEDEFNYCTV